MGAILGSTSIKNQSSRQSHFWPQTEEVWPAETKRPRISELTDEASIPFSWDMRSRCMHAFRKKPHPKNPCKPALTTLLNGFAYISGTHTTTAAGERTSETRTRVWPTKSRKRLIEMGAIYRLRLWLIRFHMQQISYIANLYTPHDIWPAIRLHLSGKLWKRMSWKQMFWHWTKEQKSYCISWPHTPRHLQISQIYSQAHTHTHTHTYGRFYSAKCTLYMLGTFLLYLLLLFRTVVCLSSQ